MHGLRAGTKGQAFNRNKELGFLWAYCVPDARVTQLDFCVRCIQPLGLIAHPVCADFLPCRLSLWVDVCVCFRPHGVCAIVGTYACYAYLDQGAKPLAKVSGSFGQSHIRRSSNQLVGVMLLTSWSDLATAPRAPIVPCIVCWFLVSCVLCC